MPILIDSTSDFKLSDFEAVMDDHQQVMLTEATLHKLTKCRSFLQNEIDQEKIIYGVTTGYGPLANRFIATDQVNQLQKNLIRMVATGIGEAMPLHHVKASMLTRLINLSKGYSGVTEECVELLSFFINNNIIPFVPELGTVGASGDLTPLAHIALALMGEGKVHYKGQWRDAKSVLEELDLSVLEPKAKEGLALINGTAVMTGIAGLNQVLTERILKLSVMLSVIYIELQNGKMEAFHPLFGEVRPHAGQQKVIRWLNQLLQTSNMVDRNKTNDQSLSHQPSHLIQDVYSLRCIPQIFGAIADVIDFHERTLLIELNAVTDNPLIFPDDESIMSGGNFMGSHIALCSDALTNALINIAVHAERVIARIVDPVLNNHLPPYLQGDNDGLNSGFMSAQVSATSIVAYVKSLATPASIQSIPTNGNNQDVVSMGTIAAQKTNVVLNRVIDLLSIEALALVQAFELKGGFEDNSLFSEPTVGFANEIRKISSFVKNDRPLYNDFKDVSEFLKSSELSRLIDGFLNES